MAVANSPDSFDGARRPHSADVNFKIGAEVRARFRGEFRWQLAGQLLDDGGRPHAVESLPRHSFPDRRSKMVAPSGMTEFSSS